LSIITPDTGPILGSLVGVTTDRETGKVLGGVLLRSNAGQSAMSDERGEYAMPHPAADPFVLTADKTGYFTYIDKTMAIGQGEIEIKNIGLEPLQKNTTSSSSTSSIQPTTTSISITTTTTIPFPPPQCTSDADCDDSLYCNGQERCIANTCIKGTPPCTGSGSQVCREDTDQCLSTVQVSATCMQRFVFRPFYRESRCIWLMLWCAAGSNAGTKSTITISGPQAGAQGLEVDAGKQLISIGRLLWVPICIQKDAEPGTWKVSIQTDVTAAGTLQNEVVEAEFEVM
jgi:hypothetical protein